MPTYQSPGVYIEEVPSGIRTIEGVATAITAFIGRTLRGPVNQPVSLYSYRDFQQSFGGLSELSPLSYAVWQFFENGGSQALIVRVHNQATAASATIGPLHLLAANPGNWGNQLKVTIDSAKKDKRLFSLLVEDGSTGQQEFFDHISLTHGAGNYLGTQLHQHSRLIRLAAPPKAIRLQPQAATAFSSDGDDGQAVTASQISAADLARHNQGIWALNQADLFNLLCIPPLSFGNDGDIGAATRNAAAAYCAQKHAVFIADPLPQWRSASDLLNGNSGINRPAWGLSQSANCAAYFPPIVMPDPLNKNTPREFAPCGAIAGVIARTDNTRGVWNAPAGVEAGVYSASSLAVNLADADYANLNPVGMNCLKTLPSGSSVVWGARTWNGNAATQSEWKYLSVRRLALYIEASLYRGTQWAVFEPNDEPLWASLRQQAGNFLDSLFRQGALQGGSSRESWFVRCDRTTTLPNDNQVNLQIGFAPLKSAEFIILEISQKTATSS